MPNIFCKILTLTNGEQCLLVKQWNDEYQEYEVIVSMHLCNIQLNQKYGFSTEEKQLTMFEDYDVAMGDNLYEKAFKMLTE